MNIFTVIIVYALSNGTVFMQTFPDVEFDSVRVCNAYAADSAESIAGKVVGNELGAEGTIEVVAGRCAQVVTTATEM